MVLVCEEMTHVYTGLILLVTLFHSIVDQAQNSPTEGVPTSIPQSKVPGIQQADDSHSGSFSLPSNSAPSQVNQNLFGVQVPSSRTELGNLSTNGPRVGVMVPASACKFSFKYSLIGCSMILMH